MSESFSSLIVSASPNVTMRLRLILDAQGADVVAVDSTEAVDRIVKQHPIRLVVVDRTTILGVPPLPGVWRIDLGSETDWVSVERRIHHVLSRPTNEAEALTTALDGARILLVDDSATYREFLRVELEREGAKVQTAKTGEEGLALLGADVFDCVMVDLVMPGMDGLEICRKAAELRRQQGQTLVLVVVVSSRENISDMIRCLEAGADEFIGKSQDIPYFKAKISAALRRKYLTDSVYR